MDWISTFGTWAAAGAAWALFALVYKQWGTQNRQLRADALERLHSTLIGDEIQHALRTVFAAKPQDFLKQPEEIRLLDAAEKVLNHYDLIGHRIIAETLPAEETLRTEWPVILRLAQQLLPFIELKREVRDNGYKEGFIYLVKLIQDDNAIKKRLADRKCDTSRQNAIKEKREKIEERLRKHAEDKSNSPLVKLINPFTNMPELPVDPLDGFQIPDLPGDGPF